MLEYVFKYLMFFLFLVISITSIIIFYRNKYKDNRIILAIISLLFINILFVLLVVQFVPGRIFDTDGTRYFYEITEISNNPFAWNPWTGTGPGGYNVTAKMGYSYIYGFILYLFNLNSLIAVLSLNIFISGILSLMIYSITFEITKSKNLSLYSLILSGVHPEILFWTTLIVRENLTLFFLTALVLLTIKVDKEKQIRYFALIPIVIIGLMLTRAQLGLFLFLIVIYLLLKYIKDLDLKGIGFIFVFLIITYLFWPLIETQIRRAVGSNLLRYLTLNIFFWIEQVKPLIFNLPKILNLVPTRGYGVLGFVLLPFSFLFLISLFISIIKNRKIYDIYNKKYANLLLFLIILFLSALSMQEIINIRFRATIAPLSVPIIIICLNYIFTRFKLNILIKQKKNERL